MWIFVSYPNMFREISENHKNNLILLVSFLWCTHVGPPNLWSKTFNILSGKFTLLVKHAGFVKHVKNTKPHFQFICTFVVLQFMTQSQKLNLTCYFLPFVTPRSKPFIVLETCHFLSEISFRILSWSPPNCTETQIDLFFPLLPTPYINLFLNFCMFII